MKKHLYFLIAAILAMLFSFSACSSDDDVNVVSVRLSENEITLNAIGATRQLTPTIIPEDATNKSVSWESSNPDIVSVTENGLVRAEGKGTAGVTVTTNNNNVRATCFVTVETPAVAPTGVTLSPATLSLVGPLMSTATPPAVIASGTQGRLTATVAPAAADQSITWSSSNPAVAQVAPDGNGTVIAVGVGTAQIRAIASNGVVSAPCEVTVTANNGNAPGNVTLMVYPPTASLIAASGNTTITPTSVTRVQLNAAIDPPNAPAGTITWASSDSAKVTVSNAGQVNALQNAATPEGGPVDVDITATYTSGTVTKTAKCVVTVAPVYRVTGVTIDPATAEIAAGTTRQLTAVIAPANATLKTITWSAQNVSPAGAVTVSNAGLVTAVRDGTATIRARSTDGTIDGNCAVTVPRVAATGVTVAPATATIRVGETQQLTATVAPENASYKTVTWSSSATATATVSNAGLVTGRAAGTATITATTADGSFQSASTITVQAAEPPPPAPAATSVAVIPYHVEMLVSTSTASTKTLTAAYTPWNGTHGAISWSSSDAAIASVNPTTGVVTAGSAPGTATIKATVAPSTGSTPLEAACVVEVVNALTVKNVYISGYNDNNPSGWWGKNGTSVRRYRNQIDYGECSGIVVDDSSYVYISGWDDNRYQQEIVDAVLYKSANPNPGLNTTASTFVNNQLAITGPDDYNEATGIVLKGTDSYTVGYVYLDYIARPVVWKNTDVATLLPVTPNSDYKALEAAAWGIAFGPDGVQHVVGTGYGANVTGALYWKGNEVFRLHPSDMEASYGKAVAASGANGYVVGNVFDGEITRGALWINGGKPVILPIPAGCDDSVPQSVAVNGSTVYIVGYSTFIDPDDYSCVVATQWIVDVAGETPVVAPPILLVNDLTGAYDSEANGVYVYRGSVYTIGFVIDYSYGSTNTNYWQVVTWQDGERVTTWGKPATGTAFIRYNYPTCIFVTDK